MKKENYTVLQTLLGAYNKHIENSQICLVDTMPAEDVATQVVIISLDQNKNLTLSNEEVTFDTVVASSSLYSEIPKEINVGISKTGAYIMYVRSESSEDAVFWPIAGSNSSVSLLPNEIKIL